MQGLRLTRNTQTGISGVIFAGKNRRTGLFLTRARVVGGHDDSNAVHSQAFLHEISRDSKAAPSLRPICKL
jgi:hypothetical protein